MRFFLWKHLEDNCYTENPKTIEQLKTAARQAVNSISKETLNEVFLNFRQLFLTILKIKLLPTKIKLILKPYAFLILLPNIKSEL